MKLREDESQGHYEHANVSIRRMMRSVAIAASHKGQLEERGQGWSFAASSLSFHHGRSILEGLSHRGQTSFQRGTVISDRAEVSLFGWSGIFYPYMIQAGYELHDRALPVDAMLGKAISQPKGTVLLSP